MKQIVMMGTRLDTMGGISSVVQVYQDQGLFQKHPVRYIATHRDGNRFKKLLWMIKAWFQLAWALCLGRVSLVHLHVGSGPSFWRKSSFIVLSMLFRVPWLFHLHGSGFVQFYERAKPWQQRWIRHVLRRAARVILLSDSWRAWAQGVCSEAKLSTLYNPIIVPPQPEPRSAGATLLFLGRLGARKGVPDLIAAVAQLVPQFPQLRLILAGDGEVEAARLQAQQLGIAAQVELPGWIDARAKQQYLKRANVYVLPSYAEGLPMSVLEAMAHGLPIVSTRVGGIPEAISEGVEGLLIDAGDVAGLVQKLRTLLEHPEQMEQMGKMARQRAVNCFASTVLLPQLEQIYRQMGVLPS